MKCHKNRMSLKIKCYSNMNVNRNEMSLKMEYHSKWNVNQNGSLSKWLKWLN